MDNWDAREFKKALSIAIIDSVANEPSFMRGPIFDAAIVIEEHVDSHTLVTLLESQGWHIEQGKKSTEEREATKHA